MLILNDLLKKIVFKIIDFFFPSKCLLCKNDIIDQLSICQTCWFALNFISKPFCNICGRPFEFSMQKNFTCLKCIANKPFYDLARGIFKFDEHSKKLIHAFKYYDMTNLAPFFASILYNKYKEEINTYDLIIPVPMHKLKRLYRLYNQAFLLAKALSKISNKKIACDVLLKSKWTKPQTFLSKKERISNLEGSFKINNQTSIKNKKIILIDDVSTTSTTIDICSKALKKHGAANILVLCIAFTPHIQ